MRARLIFGCLLLGAPAVRGAVLPPPTIKHLNAHTQMRDGIRLAANVFRPDLKTRVPTVLVRTPYGKGLELPPGYQAFVDRGYAVVVQDVRGRYASEGIFRAFAQEGPDGYDTLDWIAAQSWSDGKVGMVERLLPERGGLAGGGSIGGAQRKALHEAVEVGCAIAGRA